MKSEIDISRKVLQYLNATRIRRGWSKAKLTEEISRTGFGISPRRIHNALARRSASLSLDEGLAIAAALNTSLNELVEVATGPCPKCAGKPPEGFTCNACGGTS